MRILLTANASYVPPRGGATRSNLTWLDHLADHGHECRIVGAALTSENAGTEQQMKDEEIEISRPHDEGSGGVEILERGPIRVYSVADPARRVAVLRDQIQGFRPDWVLVSSEDLGQLLLREAHHSAPGRVVYLAHTPQLYPFGPASWNPDPQGAELVARSAGVVAIGQHTAGYVERALGVRPAVIHPPIYGEGPFPDLSDFSGGAATMINPCAVKGLPIFLELAGRMPDVEFGALPGWGTTSGDRQALERLRNVTMFANCKNIEQVLARTRVLLMPSLWYEGFGLIVTEAMLHGIPVISSDSGGLLEAKLGTRFILPVRAIERYEPVFDEHGMPKPIVEQQEIAPWMEALRRLLGDRTVYEEESRASREAALNFTGRLDAAAMERYLTSLRPVEAAARSAASEPPPRLPADALEKLSPEKRALLLKKLRSRSAQSGPE